MVFLEWQQIGKWFSTDDVNKSIQNNNANNLSNNPWKDSATNTADTPVLMLSAWLSDTRAPIGASNPIIAKEGNTVYFRNNMNNFIDNPISTAYLYSSGLRIAIDRNKSIPYDYPYIIKFKARINNYQNNNITGYESTYNFMNICNIDKKIIDGRYRLCFNSTKNVGLTTNSGPKNAQTEIVYPLSDEILNGAWFEVEVLWSEFKETVRINGYSIGSDDTTKTTSRLGTSRNEILLATSYNRNSHAPCFDISDIEVKRIYERTVTPPSIKITQEDGEEENTVKLTAQAYTDPIPDLSKH